MLTVEKRERGGEAESLARLRWSSTEKSELREWRRWRRREIHKALTLTCLGDTTERLQRCSDFGKVYSVLVDRTTLDSEIDFHTVRLKSTPLNRL